MSPLVPPACAGFCAGLGVAYAVACTTQQAHSADAVAIDLTNAICAAAADSPVGAPFVDIICSIAEPVVQGIGTLTSDDAGVPLSAFGSTAPTIRTVRLRVPAAQAAALIHGGK